MKHFKEIFGKVMVEITPTEVAMLGNSVPTVKVNGKTFAEFITWANKAFSPDLELDYACMAGGDSQIVARIKGVFHNKSASTLKANDFTEYAIIADDNYDDDGRPVGSPALYLNIPCIPDV